MRILFAAHPQLLAPVLRIIHRVIASFLLKQAGLKRTAADTDAVTLIQRFGSAANLNIHLSRAQAALARAANSLSGSSTAVGVFAVCCTFGSFARSPRARFEYQPT